jgi:sugar (pentulose or hexulose) kinase
MKLLGIDIGTTHSKAGLFESDGTVVAIASRPTKSHQHAEGFVYYDPEEMWQTIASAIQEVTRNVNAAEIGAVGIASMAESGLLVDTSTGEPRSPFMPWFDTCSMPQADFIKREADLYERFGISGLHNSFKLGLAKILWIRDRDPDALNHSTWLSSSSFIAYKLTGKMAFDYSLAARTYAFRIDRKQWDKDWIRHFGLDPELFPEAVPGGEPIGNVSGQVAAAIGLNSDTAVAIAGHDHVVAALAVGSITPGVVYDSMGTAETLVGTLTPRPLGEAEYKSGLSFGCHIAKDYYFWMGGNSASGGSVEWIRAQIDDPPMSYEVLLDLLKRTEGEGPTGILYYPYLSGSGAPVPDSKAKAAFIGLSKEHGKAEIVKAVLEGTAYQLESIRRAAAQISGSVIEKLLVIGGGTRNPTWLQIKADVSDCELQLPPIPEATMLGAAMAAGIGAGIYASAEQAVGSISKKDSRIVSPDKRTHESYRKLYEEGYMPLQTPLRKFYHI